MNGRIESGRLRRRRVAVLLGFLLLPAASLAQQPNQAEISAVRASCQSDYRAHCASVPPGGSQSLACLKQNAASLSPACLSAVDAIGGGGPASKQEPAAQAPAAESVPAAPAAPAPSVKAYPPMSPRDEFMILRRSCGRDVRMLCGDVPPGGGRVIACLRGAAASLSGRCKAAVMGAMER